MKINELFETLASNNSKNWKIDFLKSHADNDDFKEAIQLALNPMIQFYIRKIPVYTSKPVSGYKLSDAYKDLVGLSSRKFTGHAGIAHLTEILTKLDPSDAKVIERIIAKDLKCGVDTSANDVWPDLIPEFPCMLCDKNSAKNIKKINFPALAQVKMDGGRFNAIVLDGKCELRSRNGKLINLAGHLEAEFIILSEGRNVVFDGELIFGGMDRKTSNGFFIKAVNGKISDEEAVKAIANVWDVIIYEDWVKKFSPITYIDRFTVLRAKTIAFPSPLIKVVESKDVKTLEEAQDWFQELYARGEEGIILKDKHSPWESKRVKHQLKFKGEEDADLVIVAVEEGQGKIAGMLGALVGETSDGLIQTSVGSGLSEAQRKELWAVKETLPGKIMAVKYNARIKSKVVGKKESLFLPIFQVIRVDKDKANSAKELK